MENAKHPYKGEELNRKLAEFNLTRNSEEDDWNFRKRSFLTIFKIDPEHAFVFLMGGPKSEWDKIDQLFYASVSFALLHNPRFQSDEAIQGVIYGAPHDPLLLRERRNASLTNKTSRN